MKKLLALFAAMAICLSSEAQSPVKNGDGKAALLMVHFGTTFDDTRALTIDAINEKACEAFPDMKVEDVTHSHQPSQKAWHCQTYTA